MTGVGARGGEDQHCELGCVNFAVAGYKFRSR